MITWPSECSCCYSPTFVKAQGSSQKFLHFSNWNSFQVDFTPLPPPLFESKKASLVYLFRYVRNFFPYQMRGLPLPPSEMSFSVNHLKWVSVWTICNEFQLEPSAMSFNWDHLKWVSVWTICNEFQLEPSEMSFSVNHLQWVSGWTICNGFQLEPSEMSFSLKKCKNFWEGPFPNM